MNYKTSFIIIAMISFGFGIIADRFVFSSKPSEINKNSDETQNANSSKISNSNASNYSSRKQENNRNNDDSEEAENPFDNQEQDPIDNLIDQIERGKRITAAQVSSVLEQLPAGRRRREFIHRVYSHW